MQSEKSSVLPGVRLLDDITLYPAEPDPILAEEVRKKVGRDSRIGLTISGVLFVLVCLLDFGVDKPSSRTAMGLLVFGSWFLLSFLSLKKLYRKPVKRVFVAGARSLRDCVCIRSPRDYVVRYRYSGMRECIVSRCGLTIKMLDGRQLDLPCIVFANDYEMKAFAKALSEQKNVPVIDLTNREAVGVS